MTDQNDLATAIAENFENSSREELLDYAKAMEISIHPNTKEETIRGKLLEKLGKDPAKPERGVPNAPQRDIKQPDDEDDEPVEYADEPPMKVSREGMNKDDLIRLMKLNLKPRGIWQGRRHLAQITKPEGVKGNQPHPVTWGGMQIMIPWNSAVSLPEPHFNILTDANFKVLEQEEAKTKKGTPYMINHYTVENRFRLSHMGLDPKTAHLPASQQEQFKIVAENTEMFKNFNRVALAKLARRLRVKYPRDLDNEEIRMRILEKLGYDLDMFGTDDFGGAI